MFKVVILILMDFSLSKYKENDIDVVECKLQIKFSITSVIQNEFVQFKQLNDDI